MASGAGVWQSWVGGGGGVAPVLWLVPLRLGKPVRWKRKPHQRWLAHRLTGEEQTFCTPSTRGSNTLLSGPQGASVAG